MPELHERWKAIDRTGGGEKLQMVERYAHASEEYVMVMRRRAGYRRDQLPN